MTRRSVLNPGLTHWLLARGTVVASAFLALYLANGLVIGWRNAYDVMIGILSPGANRLAGIGAGPG